jgi:hypothetical protein
MSITKYQTKGETVYYVVKECGDQFRDLLDADGVTIFNPTDLKGEEIWPAR